MMMTNAHAKTFSDTNVHPVCQHSTDRKKCFELFDVLKGINSSIEITSELAARIEVERRARDRSE